MLREIKRWRDVPAVVALGSVLLFAGCAETMMGGDKGMMKEKGMMQEKGMMKEEGGMMKKEGGMMKEDKGMEKKQ